MTDEELSRWFAANKAVLESAFRAGREPWQQSGFGLHTPRTYQVWAACRRPIADCVDRSGTFLDIGSANGYLLECVCRWVAERSLTVDPFGLDVSEQHVALAQNRLPVHAERFDVGNAWDWRPLRTYDYVRTDLIYVPDELQQALVDRLLAQFVGAGGRLLVAEYYSNRDARPLTVEHRLAAMGHTVQAVTHGFWDGVEMTRVAVIGKAA